MDFHLPPSTGLQVSRVSDRGIAREWLDVGIGAAWCMTKPVSKPMHAIRGVVTAEHRRAMA